MKKVIFIDFDNTLYNTDKALIDLFESQGGKTIDDKSWKDITRWNYTDIIDGGQPVINSLFQNPTLYNEDGFYDGIVELIKTYHDKGHMVIISSIGNPENMMAKIPLLKKVMPFAIQMPVIGIDVLSLTKKFFDMRNCIFLDDSVKILNQTTAQDKILIEFGRKKEGSIGYNGLVVNNIQELDTMLGNLTQ